MTEVVTGIIVPARSPRTVYLAMSNLAAFHPTRVLVVEVTIPEEAP